MSTRLHIVVSEELVAQIDAAKHEGQPRADYIRRAVERSLAHDDGSAWREAERDVAERYGLEPPAVEQALSEAKEPRPTEQADPGSVPSLEGVRSAAPAEQSRRSGPDVAAFRRATQR